MNEQRLTDLQRENWNAVAERWSAQFGWYSAAFQSFTEWCCSAIALEPHSHVLDLASGTGLPSLAIASRLSGDGIVVATDISASMLELLSARAKAMHIDRMQFVEMDAQSLTFPDQSFDAVTCAFGLMFCPQPERVLAETFRVLKPGGRFAMSTWAPPAENTFISVYGRAVADVLQLPRYDRLAPGPFRFTNAGDLQSMFATAGFDDVQVAPRAQSVTYASLDEYISVSQALTPGLTDRLNALTHDENARLRELVAQNARPFMSGTAVHLVATPLCATGRAP